MSSYQRPWWLVVNQSGGFITTIQEKSEPGKQTYFIRGEPFIQGLAWLIWGPVGALIGVTLMTAAAMFFDVRSQSWLIKALFIGIFLVVPAVLWIAFTMLFAQLSKNYLQRVRQAEAQFCTIELDRNENALSYQSESSPAQKVAYDTIRKASVTYPVGVREGDKYLLTLDTTNGPIILLPEALGSKVQKQDLAEKIQQAINHNQSK